MRPIISLLVTSVRRILGSPRSVLIAGKPNASDEFCGDYSI